MGKVESLLLAISDIAKSEEDDLRAELVDFVEIDYLVQQIEAYEKKIARLLRAERKRLKDIIESHIAKADDPPASPTLLNQIKDSLWESDAFLVGMSEATKKFLDKTVKKITSTIMDNLDPDVPFNVFTTRTTDWIAQWSDDLASIMNLTTKSSVERLFDETLREGKSIQWLVDQLVELPDFTRQRARATAITEILTASSVAQHEAYTQSPSVTGKTWLHSGAKKNNPRPHHVALSGTTIPLEDNFLVGSSYGRYPRDTKLPARERVHCHCVLSPSVDESILGLSKEEKEAIRAEVLAAR